MKRLVTLLTLLLSDGAAGDGIREELLPLSLLCKLFS
jgi:hypothetical protein